MEAARRGMQEISFAVVAATVSAVAVFLPLTFLTDTTGRLFREFAVTVAAALSVSGFVAVTLSPALCARVVKRGEAERGLKGVLARLLVRLSEGYGALLRPVLQRPGLYTGLGVAWLALGIALFGAIDEELIPTTDRGYAFVQTQGPEGSTIEYMDQYQRQAEQILLETPEVRRAFSIVALG
jgi:multidrug efflux pump subunit AcrB